jgi:hypothetical protein
MRPFKRLKQRQKSRAFKLILAPIFERFKSENELESRGYRPLQMSFDDQLKALIFYHLQEYSPLLVIGVGICVGISITMLAITFLPSFYPVGFERIHRAGLTPVVPLIAAIRLSASACWLYVSCINNRGDYNHDYYSGD